MLLALRAAWDVDTSVERDWGASCQTQSGSSIEKETAELAQKNGIHQIFRLKSTCFPAMNGAKHLDTPISGVTCASGYANSDSLRSARSPHPTNIHVPPCSSRHDRIRIFITDSVALC